MEPELIKGDKPIAPVHHIGKDDETTQRDPFVEAVGGNSVALTPVRADKKLRPRGREL